ncbi:MAG: hypothetical protein WAU84_05920 [Thermoguttaceae bacterium]
MSDQQAHVLSLRAAYEFGDAHGLRADVDEIRDMEIEWDKTYTSSLRRGYIAELFEKHGLLEQFKTQHWPVGNTDEGRAQLRRFKRIKEQ